MPPDTGFQVLMAFVRIWAREIKLRAAPCVPFGRDIPVRWCAGAGTLCFFLACWFLWFTALHSLLALVQRAAVRHTPGIVGCVPTDTGRPTYRSVCRQEFGAEHCAIHKVRACGRLGPPPRGIVILQLLLPPSTKTGRCRTSTHTHRPVPAGRVPRSWTTRPVAAVAWFISLRGGVGRTSGHAQHPLVRVADDGQFQFTNVI